MSFQKGVCICLLFCCVFIIDAPGQEYSTDKDIAYLFPGENSVVNYQAVNLIWSTTGIGKPIKLQVATDQFFTDLLLDTSLYSVGYRLTGLERHKDYYWRLFDVEDHKATCRDVSYTFFKTTSVLMNETLALDDVVIIPAWVENKEVLYVDNPLQKQYIFRIVDERHELKFQHRGNLETYAVKTDQWPRGKYIIRLQVDGSDTFIKQFTLN